MCSTVSSFTTIDSFKYYLTLLWVSMVYRSQIKHHSFRWGARFENRRFLRFSGIFLRRSPIFFDNGFLELRCRAKANSRHLQGVKRRPFCFCLRQRRSVALPMWCLMLARSCVDLMCLCLSGSVSLVLHYFLSSLCRADFDEVWLTIWLHSLVRLLAYVGLGMDSFLCFGCFCHLLRLRFGLATLCSTSPPAETRLTVYRRPYIYVEV